MKRVQQTGHALGSTVVLTLVADESLETETIFIELWRRITQFEKQFSRFLPDSELTHFNLQAGHVTSITPSFRKLLQASQKFSQETDGLYNPFILPDLQKAGYVASWPQPDAKTAQNYSHRQRASIQHLAINENSARIPQDAALDFGGIGKGYLLDELASWLKRQGLTGYWLSLGGDIICAGEDLRGERWKVAVEAAKKPGKIAGYLAVESTGGAVATSGITKRRGQKAGRSWHHLIDPRTGEPAQTNILTASVSAQTAVQADVFAKCLVILGSDKAHEFAKQHELQASILQTEAGEIIT